MWTSHQNLKKYNTFGIEAYARYFAEAFSLAQIKEALLEASRESCPLLILGGGSNLLFTKNFPGLVLRPVLQGIEIVEDNENTVWVEAGAGIVWDDFVAWCVDRNWGGIENLSYIPGTVGAAPVQNIGAYGAEVKDCIHSVSGIYLDTLESFTLSGADCAFAYRSSLFKTSLKGKVLITKVCFVLSKSPQLNTDYGRIEQELQKQPDHSIQSVRRAVIAIRKEKLPDPAEVGNAGSFFKNPVVTEALAKQIQGQYPEMPIYPAATGYVKLPAAFLIEKCGWKGVIEGRVGVHKAQSLVLLAYEGATGAELIALSQRIQASIKQRFNVQLECEVNIV